MSGLEHIGANYKGNGECEFIIWAPFAENISLHLRSQDEKIVSLKKDDKGYWKTKLEDVAPGTLYTYQINNKLFRPDPASYYQPGDVHGPSGIIDHGSFKWQDAGWNGMALSEMVMYELHIGTFTHEGTFEAVIPRLDELKGFGINAIEIMPVSQFPGERNWGYDGVYPFAVQNSYGGPDGLKRLVDECHRKGIAVILDVVYNHLGPEGNYLRDYGPYFTDRYKTPWGEAVNFDGPHSNEIRSFFIENALYWFEYYHMDALRIDAVHGIFDMSAKHFLMELAETVDNRSRVTGKKHWLIAESDLNNIRLVQPRDKGGYGLDGHWCDDFHHCLHALLTNENDGYYADFGKTEQMAKSLAEGFVYSGQYSHFRKRNHGNSSKDVPPHHFVVFSQNHDQTGNRMNGERLSSIVSFESQKLAAGLVMLSPYIPLLFMGEEYGETAPFLYFVSHSDKDLNDAVRAGRKNEFASFGWAKEPPDPESPGTFQRSKLNWEKRYKGDGKILLDFHRALISMRKDIPALADFNRDSLNVDFDEKKKVVIMKRRQGENGLLAMFNLGPDDREFNPARLVSGWKKILDSSDRSWKGPGTLLPEQLDADIKITIRKTSFAVYSGFESEL
jgi:maltooligosyltrehalose trehalohydrolase